MLRVTLIMGKEDEHIFLPLKQFINYGVRPLSMDSLSKVLVICNQLQSEALSGKFQK